MSFRLSDLPARISDVRITPYGVTACSIAAAVFFAIQFARPSKLDTIPTVGSSGWFGSLGAGLRFLTNGTDIIQEGYKKHKPAPFKVADRYGWIVIVSSREHIEELRKAPNDELSLEDATEDLLNARSTLGDVDEIRDTPGRNTIVRTQLTRNIGTMFPETKEEIEKAFDEILGLRGNGRRMEERNDTRCYPAGRVQGEQQSIRRPSVVHVSPPIRRNPEWIDLNIQYTIDLVKTGLILSLIPKFTRPLAAYFFPAISRDIKRSVRLLGTVIEERRKHSNEGRTEKPNDFLSWLMEEGQGSQSTVRRLAGNILFLNFSAIHATSGSFAIALLYLAAHPEFILPLREEVERIVEKEGWSKTSLSKMHKVDSFLKECQRMEGVLALGMSRKAMKDFRFSDGTLIPKGTTVGVPTQCIHYDAEFYENPDVFKPFRFVDAQEADEENAKHQFVSTSVEYHPFGHGKHACPGRFFAANVMKTMLAYVVATYDVKLEDGTKQRPSFRFSTAILPNPDANVLIRKRVD